MNNVLSYSRRQIQDPPIAKLLFSDTRSAWLWLVVLPYLGWEWLSHGWEKLQDPEWQSGAAVRSFWERNIQVPTDGRPPVAFDWYRDFLAFLYNTNSHTWFGPFLSWGEFLIGVGLILGAFVGITAFFGAFLNWNLIMAGAASTNGMFLVLAMLLILAWKVAGYFGLDYFLLPRLGTPWQSPEEMPPTPKARARR